MTSTTSTLPKDLDPYSYTAHRLRRLTGLEGPSATASHGLSFKQPANVDNEPDVDDDARSDLSEEQLQQLRAQSTRQEVERLVERHISDEDAPPTEALEEIPPAFDVPRGVSVGKVDHPGPGGGSTGDGAPQTVPRSSSADTLKASKPPSAGKARSTPTDDPSLDAKHTTTSPQRLKSPPQQSSDSSDQMWLSAPASRQPSHESPHMRPRPSIKNSRSGSAASFVTANEDVTPSPSRLSSVAEVDSSSTRNSMNDPPASQRASYQSPQQRYSVASQTVMSPIAPALSRSNSNTALLHHEPPESGVEQARATLDGNASDAAEGPSRSRSKSYQATDRDDGASKSSGNRLQPRSTTGLVRFDIPPETQDKDRKRTVKLKLAQIQKRGTFKLARRNSGKAGEAIKMENMLVRIDFTNHKVPDEFTERDSQHIEMTIIERWREYMCVCRKNAEEDCPFVLHLYKSRVVPAVETTSVKRRWTHEIQLRKSNCKVNLFSPLDKSIAIWYPSRRGTIIFTLQARSGASSMEWFTFMKNTFGWNRSQLLQINVPDLSVNLRIDRPFESIESSRQEAQEADDSDLAVYKTMQAEQAAAARIIGHCMQMLNEAPDWTDVIKQWQGKHKMGLAWKRYDRLEWVHGANEQKMYGTMGMERSHELELRPKQHYPTHVAERKNEQMQEPPPVEGFLIRLTSQKGKFKKFGKLFYKRLYFSTHNQFLLFNRPARADPPPPPRLPMTEDAHVPSAERIAEKTPLIYAVNPYPIFQDSIEWLSPHNRNIATNSTPRSHDLDAYDENQRKLGLLRNCDGLLNLCNVVEVRNIQRGATPADDRVGSGPDVSYHQPVPNTLQDDGVTKEVDDDRVFELVLKNGLIIRLQAYNKTTKTEWMTRLRNLIKYWNLRTTADIHTYKSIRQENAERLKIDEAMESLIGQYASKWEVKNSAASPEQYNMCNIACCRSVSMSGHLYHKGRHHGSFTRMLCVISHGKLLMFADALRTRDGKIIKNTHHERVDTLDLKECYVYSGLATADNNLYSGGTSVIDRARPGRHGLPRIWLDDGWSSSDEDTSVCFVIWHGKKSGWFRGQEEDSITQHERSPTSKLVGRAKKKKSQFLGGPGAEGGSKSRQRLRRVKKLGKEGTSMVFRARSRAERDHWVLSVGMEIERVQTGDEVRVVERER
ncbi:MAG: hypothetical protein Q9162_002330 [Coniocarpon cinnabarinum]